MSAFVDTRRITLQNGQELDVSLTEEIKGRMRTHFCLDAGAELQDQHVASFVLGALKTAVEKAESEDS